jgi:MFS family permease
LSLPAEDRALNYLTFAFENRRFLGFGFLITCFAGIGQTFFIALFSAEIRAEFGLSHGTFALVYALATTASALVLMWTGRKIDDIDLRLYSALACGALVLACFMIGLAHSMALLFAAVFLLRHAGQGLMTHIAHTSMARYFELGRGKALSLASLGLPVGVALFPLVTVVLVQSLGWRASWLVIGAVLAVGLVPLVLWLLRGQAERHRALTARVAVAAGASRDVQWSRREVLGDVRFYLLAPVVLAYPFTLAGFFFHQVHLAESKGWSLTWLATIYVGFAVATILVSLVTGPLVDRWGARRLMPYHALPVGLGLLVLAAFDHPYAGALYMILAGTSSAAGRCVIGAVWPEIYGVAHLGAIRALVTALMVIASAVSPLMMGLLIDRGVSIEIISVGMAGYIGAAAVLALVPALSGPSSLARA